MMNRAYLRSDAALLPLPSRERVGVRGITRQLILCLLLLWPAFTLAAESSAALAWDQLSKEEQQTLKPFQERWDSLPPERREHLQQGAKRWQSMTSEQREQAKDRFARWQKMTPEQREMARKRYERFRQLPPEQIGRAHV